jgi:hypothetical protein
MTATGNRNLAPGQHLIPLSSAIWLAHEGFPAQVRHLFLGHSAAEILCFRQLGPEWQRHPGDVAFATFGLLADTAQVHLLKDHFAKTKV